MLQLLALGHTELGYIIETAGFVSLGPEVFQPQVGVFVLFPGSWIPDIEKFDVVCCMIPRDGGV